ncbi:MAG TPA: flagellar biosynthetic protein FliO [Caulobacteraceae bacterium]|jgi:flagellar protein FliO/FliZ|nr:flagellar biosynthetic protein FliO [Caulobacteraceae bacterium]
MFLAVIQAVFGLALTLGLIGLAAYAARRWGPSGMFQMRPPGERRLAIVESLTLDPTRRLVLVRFDQEERLLLLGEGRMLGQSAAESARRPTPAKG